MHRMSRALLALFFVVVIMLSSVVLVGKLTKTWRADLTENRHYTLSEGSRKILAKLNQPISLKLYYAKEAAKEAPDAIRDYNNYYQYVVEFLVEYERAGGGKVELQIIDPRPFSQAEEDALRYGLQRYPISEEENFFFGLVAQTPFGVTKSIPFFKPDRQGFIEYDISQLIDSAIQRQKLRVGVLSSLPVMGEDQMGYMAQMKRAQGQPLQEPWILIQQLRQRYEVNEIPVDTEAISPDATDVLIVIHPKELGERALFAIDQYVLKGGKTIVCVDPHAWVDQPDRMAQMSGQMPSSSSNMPGLLKAWGLEMKPDEFVGDRSLAIETSLSQNQRPGPVIGFLDLIPEMKCFNETSVITANLNEVRILFAGALKQTQTAVATQENAGQMPASPSLKYEPLLVTSDRGNTWSVANPYELMMPRPERWLESFTDGDKPVVMGYLVTGQFRSAFPDGIEVEVKAADENAEENKEGESAPEPRMEKVTGLTEAQAEGAVAVYADVDFISDMIAYQRSFFGASMAGDNASCLMNTVDFLTNSDELISIRSRGTFRRPFERVKAIEDAAARENREEINRINAEIEGFQKELNEMAAKMSTEELMAGAVNQKRQLELNIRNAQKRQKEVQLQKNVNIEALKNRLMWLNIAFAPLVVLAAAVFLAIFRQVRRRVYVSHASDA